MKCTTISHSHRGKQLPFIPATFNLSISILWGIVKLKNKPKSSISQRWSGYYFPTSHVIFTIHESRSDELIGRLDFCNAKVLPLLGQRDQRNRLVRFLLHGRQFCFRVGRIRELS